MEEKSGVDGGGWSYRGMSSDNIKGLVLALSSSFFIGASFIVKKKGLKKAGASGLRAGISLNFMSVLVLSVSICGALFFGQFFNLISSLLLKFSDIIFLSLDV